MFDFHRREIGLFKHEEIDNVIYNKILNDIRGMKVCNEKRIFYSRTASLKWHPNNENVLLLGSKHGTVTSWDVTANLNENTLNNEIGPGHSITSINISPSKPQNIIYTSVNGSTSYKDMESNKVTVILNSSQFSRWYSCSAISLVNDFLLVGDNFGGVTIMDTENGNNVTKIGHLHLHTGKINYMEFCPWNDYLIVTASNDFTVCLWDYRLLLAKLSSLNDTVPPKREALSTFFHKSGVSSAKFNLQQSMGRDRYLVTIDQMREIRIYQESGGGTDLAQSWICTKIIEQHHRFYHHKTPFNVDWHPNSNLIAVGHLGASPLSYCSGDRNKEKLEEEMEPTIDVIQASTGRVIYKFRPSMSQICSTLNSFSCNGSYLASTCCFDVVIRATENAAENFKQTDRIRNRGF